MVLDSFRDRVAIRPLGQSFAVDVQFEANDPAKAALIANTIVQAYIATVIDADQQREQKQRDWLESRVVDLRKNVADAERAVAEMTVRRGIAEIGQVTVTDRQIADTSSELARARAHGGQGVGAGALGSERRSRDHQRGERSASVWPDEARDSCVLGMSGRERGVERNLLSRGRIFPPHKIIFGNGPLTGKSDVLILR